MYTPSASVKLSMYNAMDTVTVGTPSLSTLKMLRRCQSRPAAVDGPPPRTLPSTVAWVTSTFLPGWATVCALSIHTRASRVDGHQWRAMIRPASQPRCSHPTNKSWACTPSSAAILDQHQQRGPQTPPDRQQQNRCAIPRPGGPQCPQGGHREQRRRTCCQRVARRRGSGTKGGHSTLVSSPSGPHRVDLPRTPPCGVLQRYLQTKRHTAHGSLGVRM